LKKGGGKGWDGKRGGKSTKGNLVTEGIHGKKDREKFVASLTPWGGGGGKPVQVVALGVDQETH